MNNLTMKKMRKAWTAYKEEEINGSKSIAEIYKTENNEPIGDGEEVLLLTAIFELRIYRIAIQLGVSSGFVEKNHHLNNPIDEKNSLFAEFKYQYEKFSIDEKWGLLPLFFDLEMQSENSLYLEKKYSSKFYPLFLDLLKKDKLTLSSLKNQFLNSGYNKLMPFLGQLDPQIFGKQDNFQETIDKEDKSSEKLDDNNKPKGKTKSKGSTGFKNGKSNKQTDNQKNIRIIRDGKIRGHTYYRNNENQKHILKNLLSALINIFNSFFKFSTSTYLKSKLSEVFISMLVSNIFWVGFNYSLKVSVFQKLHEQTLISYFSILSFIFFALATFALAFILAVYDDLTDHPSPYLSEYEKTSMILVIINIFGLSIGLIGMFVMNFGSGILNFVSFGFCLFYSALIVFVFSKDRV